MHQFGMERGWKPNVEISPSCPRCGSSNTKFCYYNNYSLTQPRYFCKGCRRYWTKGGSLRNVPVGGGCRKNRRSGKSLRLSNEVAGHHHRRFGNELLRDSYVHRGISSVEPSSSSMNINPDGSHIDLALVYANFLNQQQDAKSSTIGFEMAELPGEFDPSLPFTSISSTKSLEPSVPLPEENGLAGCLPVSELRMGAPLNNDNDQLMYYCGLDLAHKHQDRIQQYTTHQDTSNYGLPPLPGEEVACHDQDILWSNSHMKDDHHSLQMTQQPGLEQDPNLLFGNWSSFGLPSDDTFPRT